MLRLSADGAGLGLPSIGGVAAETADSLANASAGIGAGF